VHNWPEGKQERLEETGTPWGKDSQIPSRLSENSENISVPRAPCRYE